MANRVPKTINLEFDRSFGDVSFDENLAYKHLLNQNRFKQFKTLTNHDKLYTNL